MDYSRVILFDLIDLTSQLQDLILFLPYLAFNRFDWALKLNIGTAFLFGALLKIEVLVAILVFQVLQVSKLTLEALELLLQLPDLVVTVSDTCLLLFQFVLLLFDGSV